MNCIACGKELNPGARFCSNCGQSVAARPFTPAQPFAPTDPYAPARTRLYRPRNGRMIAGVCAGFAQAYGWDIVPVRILLAVFVFLGCGTPILAYIIAWIVMPNEPYFFPAQTYAQPPAPPAPPSSQQPSA